MPTESEGWSRRPLDSQPRAEKPQGRADPGHGRDEGGGAPPTAPALPSSPDRGRDAFDPAAAYLATLGSGSRRTMREALEKLARWASDDRCGPHELPWHRLRIEHTTALRARLMSSLAPATANKHLAALRGVLRQCWQRGLISTADYQRAIDLPPVRGGSSRPRQRRLDADDLRRLAEVCWNDESPAGARDEALLALLYGAQLRRSEAVALDLEDYEAPRGELVVRGTSPEKTRRFVANADARRALDRWLGFRGSEPGPLFNPVNKGGRIEPRRLSQQAIYIACQKRAAEAGLPPTSPEDLRRADTTPRQPVREDETRADRSGESANSAFSC